MELVLEAGADDLLKEDDRFEIKTAVEKFEAVRKALEDKGIEMEFAEITRLPGNTVEVNEKKGRQLLRLMDLLEDHEDVQKAYSNFDIPEEVMVAIEQNS